MYGTNEEMELAILLGVLVFYFAILGIGLACWIMNSLALQRLGTRRMLPYPWMVWFPYANAYFIGRLADDYDERNGIKRKWRVVLLTLNIISVVGIIVGYCFMIAAIILLALNGDAMVYGNTEALAGIITSMLIGYVILLITILVAMAYSACMMICLYKIFESTVPEKSVKYMLISLLVPFGQSICLLCCRNKGYSREPIVPNAAPAVQIVEQEEIPVDSTTPEEE